MTDRRVTPNADYVTGRKPAQLSVPVSDIRRTPDGPRDRQLLFGDTLTILGQQADWAYIQSDKDGYCGFVRLADLTAASPATHRVSAPATHAYSQADFKSAERLNLSFGSRVTVTGQADRFCETNAGYIPERHLTPVDSPAKDPADIAALFLGTPYLWGGNSRSGIDCSGLVQAALLTCGIDCPGDSDQQEQQLGVHANTTYRRNDLLFWKGHVAMVTDEKTLIHANAHDMAVAYEPIKDAIERIKAQGDGPMTAHKRLVFSPD